MLVHRGEEGLNGLKFGTFTGRFRSNGAASMAVKGLIGKSQISVLLLCFLDFTVQELCESRGGRPGLSVLTSLLVSVDVKLY